MTGQEENQELTLLIRFKAILPRVSLYPNAQSLV
jgi:hypothetical protein